MKMIYEILVGLLLFMSEIIVNLFSGIKDFLVFPFKSKNNKFLIEITKLNLFIMIPISIFSFWALGQIHLLFALLGIVFVPIIISEYASHKTKLPIDSDNFFGYMVISFIIIGILSGITFKNSIPVYTKIGEIKVKSIQKEGKFNFNDSLVTVVFSKKDKVGDTVNIYKEDIDNFWFKTRSKYYTYKPKLIEKIKHIK
jgi:hypothetical protein